jgi:hypothetical protein
MFTHKNILIGCLSVLILVIASQAGLFEVPTAHAINLSLGTGTEVRGSLGDDLVDLIGKLAFVNTFMHVILLIILQFLGYLLQADFFNDPAMMSALYSIWVVSRDIMNILFALMLIGVSFYVIITGKTEKAKEHVVNFVVAVILVNFSWFFPRVIIDVANVVAATVYSVPNTIMSASPCQTLEAGGGKKPCQVIVDVEIFPNPREVVDFKIKHGPAASCTEGIECHAKADLASSMGTMSSANTIINGLAVSFARISVLAKIPASKTPPGIPLPVPSPGGLPAKDAVMISFQIAISIMLSFAIQLAVILPLLGLAVGLFLRIVILWVTTAFMPFSFLGYVVNGKLGTAVFGFETDIWKEFINAAFLPAVVAIPFSIGFVMLSAVANIPEPAGAFPLVMKMPIIAGVDRWWQLIWTMAAIAIIWTGAFKALARSTLVSGITEKIRGFGEGVFSGIAHAPLLIPLPLPGGAKSGMNLGTLVHGPKIAADTIRLAAGGRTGKGASQLLSEAFGGGGKRGIEETDRLAERLKISGDTNTNKLIDAIRGINTAATDVDRNGHFKKIHEALEAAGIEHNKNSEFDMKKLLEDMAHSKKAPTELQAPDIKGLIKAITPRN